MTPELIFNQTPGFTFKFRQKNRGLYKWSPWEENLNRVESNPKTCQLTTWPAARSWEKAWASKVFFHEHKTPFHSSPTSFTHLNKLPIKTWCFIYPSLTSPPPAVPATMASALRRLSTESAKCAAENLSRSNSFDGLWFAKELEVFERRGGQNETGQRERCVV